MTKEFKNSQGMPDVESFSKAAKAIRVTEGAIPFKIDEATGRNIQPTSQAIGLVSVSVALEPDKFYRINSTVNCYIAISNDSALAATASDFFVPANTPMVISTLNNGMTSISILGSAVGNFQIMEI